MSACAADLASFPNVVVDVVDVGESGDVCRESEEPFVSYNFGKFSGLRTFYLTKIFLL